MVELWSESKKHGSEPVFISATPWSLFWDVSGSQSLKFVPQLLVWYIALLVWGRQPWKHFPTHFVRRMPCLLLFFSPNPPLREHHLCRILKWLRRTHMKLWFEKDSKQCNVNFSPAQYTVQNLNFSFLHCHSTFSFLTPKCLDLLSLEFKTCQTTHGQ